MSMSSDLNLPEADPSGVEPMVRCATAAVAVVGDEMATLSGEHGRAGMMVCLRLRSHELSHSALAEDQVLSRAFEAAADDVAWGRMPLQAWLWEMCDPCKAPEDQRAAIRATLPHSGHAITGPAQALVREIEARWARSGDDAFDTVRRRGEYLAAVRALQAQAFDDPRLRATPALRAVMRCSADLLADMIRPPAGSPSGGASEAPAVPGGHWRRLMRWRLWLRPGPGRPDCDRGRRGRDA